MEPEAFKCLILCRLVLSSAWGVIFLYPSGSTGNGDDVLSEEHLSDNDQEITAMLQRSRSDAEAREAVFQLVYADLRRLAGHRIAAARPGERAGSSAPRVPGSAICLHLRHSPLCGIAITCRRIGSVVPSRNRRKLALPPHPGDQICGPR